MNIEEYSNIQCEHSIEKLMKLLEVCKELKEKKKNNINIRNHRSIKKKMSNTLNIINKLRSNIIEDPNIDNQERIAWLDSNDITLITDNNNLVIDIE